MIRDRGLDRTDTYDVFIVRLEGPLMSHLEAFVKAYKCKLSVTYNRLELRAYFANSAILELISAVFLG